jgi:two-component system nitrate/nitrite response regulator NarL
MTMLTDRQQQVATLVCDGLSNKMIARKLGVSEGTVKLHLHAIYVKLDVLSRTELMIALTNPARSKPRFASSLLAVPSRWRRAR